MVCRVLNEYNYEKNNSAVPFREELRCKLDMSSNN